MRFANWEKIDGGRVEVSMCGVRVQMLNESQHPRIKEGHRHEALAQDRGTAC